MKTYTSNTEFFNAVSSLIERIEKSGNASAAQELRSGFSCLNGLTDGWGLFMEAIEKTEADHGEILQREQKSELDDMLATVRKIVYR